MITWSPPQNPYKIYHAKRHSISILEGNSYYMENKIDAHMSGYEMLVSLQASLSEQPKQIGSIGKCRFCGEKSPEKFRHRAHLIPEALGNKWLFSQDECDVCNKLFGTYDQALANAIGAVLTLGGTKGKKNKVRKTGLTDGLSTLRRSTGPDGRPQISAMSGHVDFANIMKRNRKSGALNMSVPLPPTPFRPRHAYKSLCKMGVALLPEDELKNFQKLIQWLQDPQDDKDFLDLSVGLSFGMIGNAPPIASVTLMRRTDPKNATPYMFFTLSIGSICCSIDLMPDSLDDHMPPITEYSINIAWQTILADDDGKPQIAIKYEHPITLNWASSGLRPQPLKSFTLKFDPRTKHGKFTPNFR